MEPRASLVLTSPAEHGIDIAAVEAMSCVIRALASRHTPREEPWDDPKFWNSEASRRDRCQYLAVGNAINFRFWSLQDGILIPAGGPVEGERFRGSMYMWRRLRLACQREELDLSADGLTEVDEDNFNRAFADDTGSNPLTIAAPERVANLRDLGRRLRDDWNGWFENLVNVCAGSLDAFAKHSKRFRAYDDPIQKLTMVNAIMLQGSGLVTFDKPPLPAVDYHLVKHAVRQGLVRPDPTIHTKLRDGVLLTLQESEQLRRLVLHALTMVAAGAGISSAVLDNLYWLNRRTCADQRPDCDACPFRHGCAQIVELGLPLEETRYY